MVETGWVQPTTTPCLPAALRALQNREPLWHHGGPPGPRPMGEASWNSSRGQPAISKSHGSPAPWTGVQHSIPSPPNHQCAAPVLLPLGRGGAQRHPFLASFLVPLSCFLLWSCSVSVPFSALGVSPTDDWKRGNLLGPTFSSPTRAEEGDMCSGALQAAP